MSNTALVPVSFHGDTLMAVAIEGRHYISIRSVCDAVGIDYSAQRQRIMRHAVMAEGVVVITTPSAGGPQETLCLPLDKLNGWLFGVNTSRVRPELRDKLIAYQRECFDVLAQHFGVAPRTSTVELASALAQTHAVLNQLSNELVAELAAGRAEREAFRVERASFSIQTRMARRDTDRLFSKVIRALRPEAELPRARPWTVEEQMRCLQLHQQHVSPSDIATMLGRSKASVHRFLQKVAAEQTTKQHTLM